MASLPAQTLPFGEAERLELMADQAAAKHKGGFAKADIGINRGPLQHSSRVIVLQFSPGSGTRVSRQEPTVFRRIVLFNLGVLCAFARISSVNPRRGDGQAFFTRLSRFIEVWGWAMGLGYEDLGWP